MALIPQNPFYQFLMRFDFVLCFGNVCHNYLNITIDSLFFFASTEDTFYDSVNDDPLLSHCESNGTKKEETWEADLARVCY